MPTLTRKRNTNQMVRMGLIFFLHALIFSGHIALATELTSEDVRAEFNGDTVGQSSVDQNAAYFVVPKGIAMGASMNMASSSQLRRFDIYGRAVENNSEKIIGIGYKKRF